MQLLQPKLKHMKISTKQSHTYELRFPLNVLTPTEKQIDHLQSTTNAHTNQNQHRKITQPNNQREKRIIVKIGTL